MKQAGRVSDAPPLLILIWFILILILILIIPMKQAGRVSSGTSLFDPLLNSLHPTQLGLIVMRRIKKGYFTKQPRSRNYSLCKDCCCFCPDRIFMIHHIVKPQSGIDVSLPLDIWLCQILRIGCDGDEDFKSGAQHLSETSMGYKVNLFCVN